MMKVPIASSWMRHARAALPIGLCLLLAIGLATAIGGILQEKKQFTVFLFMRQDLIVAIMIALWIRFGLKPDAQLQGQARWMQVIAIHPYMVALSLGILCWAGHHLLLLGHDLTRDEQMASFDAQIFASGWLYLPIPPAWHPMAEALNQLFILPIAERASWVSAYLPVNAAARSLLLIFGDAGLTSPLFTALGALALWRITVRLWPEDPGARVAALLLYTGSSQVLLLGMTAYAMAGHLALNLIWLVLFLRGGWSHVAAIVIGFLATGLHQPLFHPLFVLPFIVGLLWQKRWFLTALYCGAYLVIGLFWLGWPNLIAASAGGAMQAVSATGDHFSYADRAIGMLGELSPASLCLMAMNLLRFVTWQHLLMLPLSVAGGCLAWRAPLVRPLAAGILLTILVVGVLLAYQGHGWGYRYLHGIIGNVCLLGGYGWRALRGMWPNYRFWAWSNFVNFFLLMPLHASMSAHITAPYAHVSTKIGTMPAEIVVIDDGAVAFGGDLVINAPNLSNRPLRLLATRLTVEQISALCMTQKIAFVGRRDMAAIAKVITAQAGDDAHFRALQQACHLARGNPHGSPQRTYR